MFEELRNASRSDGIGGFLPAVRQIGNVAALPAIVSVNFFMMIHYILNRSIIIRVSKIHVNEGSPLFLFPRTTWSCCHLLILVLSLLQASIGLPDIHSGYGFAIGNIAAFDVSDQKAIVSPGSNILAFWWWFRCLDDVANINFSGGVGFDINCGVRLIRTSLSENDVQPVKEQLAQSLFDHIPVGVGSKGIIPIGASQFEVWNFFRWIYNNFSIRKYISWMKEKSHEWKNFMFFASTEEIIQLY